MAMGKRFLKHGGVAALLLCVLASASAWAKQLAISRSWWRPSGLSDRMTPSRSQGTIRVPWWISW